MPVTRNQIFSALFALAENVSWTTEGAAGTWVTTGRRFRAPADCGPEFQPALFQVEHEEGFTQRTNMPSIRTMGATWIVYQSAAKDSGAIPTLLNNDILDGLEAALMPPPGQTKQTLGGLVHHAWIEGEVLKDPGDIDEWGLIIVPIRIMVP